MIAILIIILFFMLMIIGKDRGVDAFWTLLWNFVTLIITVILLSKGVNIFITTLISCLIISCITLFYQNGFNVKTTVAFKSVFIILLLLVVITFITGTYSNLQGFGSEYIDINESYGYSGNIRINMLHIAISVIIIGLMGAILDTALSISSATYEVYMNNNHLTKNELFISAMNIGKDILGTTVNTLFFIFAGESLTLLILMEKNYSFSNMINSKIFCQEIMQILFSTIGCVLIIPATAFLSSRNIVRKIRS